MKAKYMKPSIYIQTVEPSSIICNSTPGIVNGEADTTSEQDGGGYMLSRHRTLWDDED